MLAVISPAKKLDLTSEHLNVQTTQPELFKESKKLLKELKKVTSEDFQKLCKISPKLGDLNFERYQTFDMKNQNNTRAAVFSFAGDTYVGLDASSFSKSDINYAQKNLRILSGLYGVLKPLDLIQPYRLEMGTKFSVGTHKNLYSFWNKDLTNLINNDLSSNKTIVNLASKEYFSAIDKEQFKGSIIEVDFKQKKDGGYKSIGIFAKRGRGMMASFIIKNKIKKREDLIKFNLDGYKFNKSLSQDNHLVFTRDPK